MPEQKLLDNFFFFLQFLKKKKKNLDKVNRRELEKQKQKNVANKKKVANAIGNFPQ